MTDWANLQRASDNLAIQLVNLDVMQKVNPVGLCKGYDETLEKVIVQVENNRHTLRLEDCRTIIINEDIKCH